jgi:hypothetical protein
MNIQTQAALSMIWVTFGEVNSIVAQIDSSLSPQMGACMHIVWIIFTNVLLVNLLISMMAETFRLDQADTHSSVGFVVCMCVCVCARARVCTHVYADFVYIIFQYVVSSRMAYLNLW